MKNFHLFFLFAMAGLFGKLYSSSSNTFTSVRHLTMAGAGYLYPSSIAMKTNPSSFRNYRSFESSIIKFPADIISQSIGYGFQQKTGYCSFSLAHLSYGVFDGYDNNGIFTSTYSSSNTRISGAYAHQLKKFPVFIGSKISWVSSNLGNELENSLKLSIGKNIVLQNLQTSLGFSLHEIGILGGDNNEKNSMQIVASISKKLAYLPLTTYFDLGTSDFFKTNEYFFGGIFNLKNKLMISYGTSSRKIIQNINQNFFKTVFGATGFGFSYNTGNIIIEYGSYFYGTGAKANGFSVEVMF